MVAKKNKKKSSKVVDVILSTLKQNLFPSMLKKVSEKIHHEIKLVTSDIEYKSKKIINHLINKSMIAILILVAFLFLLFGGLYFLIDILSIERSYVLLGLGVLLFIIVFISNLKAKD